MDNGTAEMEPAKIAATKDVSTDVEVQQLNAILIYLQLE